MTRINLLPWRVARRKQQQQSFSILLIAAALLAAGGVYAAQMQIDTLIQNQEARNQYLRGEITRLKKAEAEIQELDRTKARLLGRLKIIQDLQSRRPDMVRVLDALARLLPEDIYLSTLKNEGTQLTLKGVALSNNTISVFMRRLAESPEFGEPVLRFVETKDINEVQASAFEMTVNRKIRSQGAREGQDSGAAQ